MPTNIPDVIPRKTKKKNTPARKSSYEGGPPLRDNTLLMIKATIPAAPITAAIQPGIELLDIAPGIPKARKIMQTARTIWRSIVEGKALPDLPPGRRRFNNILGK